MNSNGQNSINNKSCRPGFKILDGETKCSRGICTHPVDDPRATFCNDAVEASIEVPDGGMGGVKPEEPKKKEKGRTCKTVEHCYKTGACSADAACKCIQNKCESKVMDNCENHNVCPLSIKFIASNYYQNTEKQLFTSLESFTFTS